VLAKAIRVSGLEWDDGSAHSASYDAERSADLFCLICNRLHESFREAQNRACAFGWLSSPPTESNDE
jgi:ribonuclease T